MAYHFRKYYCFLFIIFNFFISFGSIAQDQKVADSLSRIYRKNILSDTAKLKLLYDLSYNEINNYKLAIKYAEELISHAQKENNNTYLCYGYFIKGTKERLLGKFDEALKDGFKSAELAKSNHSLKVEAQCYNEIANTYSAAGNHPNAEAYFNSAITILRQSKDSVSLAIVLSNFGDELYNIKNYDSALAYFKESKQIFDTKNYLSNEGYSLGNIGMVYASTGKNQLAEDNINEAIKLLEAEQDYYPICTYLLSMADIYSSKKDNKTALNYASRSLNLAEQHQLKEQIKDANLKLSELYEKTGNLSQSLKYYKKYALYKDSTNDYAKAMFDLRTKFEVSQKQIIVDRLNQQKKAQRNLLISTAIILFLAIIILFILFSNNRSKRKAYEVLTAQKQETEAQKTKAENAFIELRATQRQLIQSEKMASLGQLTAGIAHEIQNPLNFVNNFSEVSAELLKDMAETTLHKLPPADKIQADEIINDIADNLNKINIHGKRAEAIVKGMLQHSRAADNKRELTDINALAEEYLRVCYHALQAKDSSFSITIETSFDNRVPKFLIARLDVGRVLLNIYNNAFYSLQQKLKLNDESYVPTLLLTTIAILKNSEVKAVQICIKDNGTGIPDKILDKIYQPFFTTKPTGIGTGLGLYLSYDIIINEHEGQLKVDTKEGEYTSFTIELPYKV